MAWEPHGASGTLTLSPELETPEAQPGLLCRWLLAAQEVSCRLGSQGWNPCCEAQGGGVWSVGRQESPSEKWGQRWHSGSPRLCGCSTWVKTENPRLLQDPQPHLPLITSSCFTLGGEPLALFHDKPYRSITWWLSTRTKGRQPRSGS